MAEQAEGAEVVEVALAAALGDGEDVVGVPEGAAGMDGAQSPDFQGFVAGAAAGALQGVVSLHGVGRAKGADAAVAEEDLVAQIAWIGAQAPLVDAELGAEGPAAAREDLQLAPAAERAIAGRRRWSKHVGVVGCGQATRRMLSGSIQSGHFPSIKALS